MRKAFNILEASLKFPPYLEGYVAAYDCFLDHAQERDREEIRMELLPQGRPAARVQGTKRHWSLINRPDPGVIRSRCAPFRFDTLAVIPRATYLKCG